MTDENKSMSGDVISPSDALTEQTLSVDLERAAIDMQIATAHKYPRSLDVVIKRVKTMACYNESAAENCVYSLPRGGKPIIGPSIGFANIVATAWGNCVDGSRWVATDRKEKVVIAEGVFHDYETNRKTIITEQRRIVDSRGRLYSDDMIVVTSKAAGAIARRNAILQIVPRALWFPIWEDALHIVRGDTSTFSEHKEKAIRAFAQFGVKPEQLFQWLGIRGEPDMTLEHIPILRGGYQSLRDGATTVEEMFDPRRMTGKGFETVTNPLADDEDEADEAAPAHRPANAQHAPAARAAAPEGDVDPGSDAPFDMDDVNDTPTAGATEGAPARKPPQRKPRAAKGAAKETAVPDERGEQATAAAPAKQERQEVAAPAADEPPKPKTTQEYVAYWRNIMASATSATGLEERWKSPLERALRGNCSVIEDDLVALREEQNKRLAELRAA